MKKVVVIGGGTGSFTLLKGLKNYDLELNAIVSTADNGGSSGQLRDEFGILPPGDLRRCLIALSEGDEIWREIFNYQFKGRNEKHNLGNLIMTAMNEIKGDFCLALEEISKILNISGKVIPVTLDNTHLCAELENGEIIKGETNIDVPKHNTEIKIKKVYLEPKAFAYKEAIKSITNADIIILCPGDIYTSLIPNLLVEGIAPAIKNSHAKKVYICNVMTKHGETDNFKAQDFVTKIEEYLRLKPDYILCNNKKPPKEILDLYIEEKSYFVEPEIDTKKYNVIFADLIDEKNILSKEKKLIRHDSIKIANTIMNLPI
jgi:uncharacterized cofD-like protein